MEFPAYEVRTEMRSRVIVVFLLIFAFCKPSLGHCAEQQWPIIAEFTAKVGIDTSANGIFFTLPLLDVHGITQYSLICVGGSNGFLGNPSIFGGTKDTNYVGQFACGLTKGNSHEIENSLLSEDESPYWFSRGRVINFRDLIGACGRYPEYGALRHFRLRNLELTLDFRDMSLDKNGNPAFIILAVSVRRDPTATTAQAEQTGFLTPYKSGLSCEKVLHGNAPRMCRDWVHPEHYGSWTECSKLGK